MSNYHRHKKESNYSQIDNHVFRDKTLSMKAKGLLAQIYSLPDNWEYSVRGLTTLFHDGKEAVNNALQELIDHGYIIRSQRVNAFGQFEGYDYDIYETPQEALVSENPITGNPSTGNPITDNSTQLISNRLNTNISISNNISNNPLISPNETRQALFNQFWAAYPKCKRKINKSGCERKFIKIPDLENIFPTIMASLESWKQDWSKKNYEYVPRPEKWITQQYWTVTDMRTEREQIVDDTLRSSMAEFIGGGGE